MEPLSVIAARGAVFYEHSSYLVVIVIIPKT